MSTPEKPPAAPGEIVELVRTIAAALAVALLLRVLLFQPFTIPSESMEPNLLVGDYVVITKFDYGWSRYSIPLSLPLFAGQIAPRLVKRGDVVVFKKPGDEHAEDVIKRVVGLPGDRVRVSGGAVWLNEQLVAREPAGAGRDPGDASVAVTMYRETLGVHRPITLDRGAGHPGDDTGVYVVPAGHYFVMGDNRDNSADSRWPRGTGMGFVPAENVVGKARIVLWSWKPGASLFKPWTWPNLRGERFFRPIA
ncbi:MAG: signal peptidase I [Phenylobacterium sp.]